MHSVLIRRLRGLLYSSVWQRFFRSIIKIIVVRFICFPGQAWSSRFRCCSFYVCKLISYARFPPKRVNQFEWNFEGVYSSLSAFVWYMYRLTFLCPLSKYFSHRTYMTLWGNAPLPVQGWNRKSKIALCSRAWWTLYTLKVSSKSDHVSGRR